jgi:hypothetical protein
VGAFREIVIGEVFENMFANSTNHEMLPAAVLPTFSENLCRNPSEKQGAHYNHQVNGDHSIEGDTKHEFYA